jgi:hypothetical protein
MYGILNGKVIRYKLQSKYNFNDLDTPIEELKTSENDRTRLAKEIVINSDGTKLFVKVNYISFGNDLILQYNLSVPFSLNSASLVDQFEVFYAFSGLQISSDDKTIFLMQNRGRNIFGYRFVDSEKISSLKHNPEYSMSSTQSSTSYPYTISKTGRSILLNPIINQTTIRKLRRLLIDEEWKLNTVKTFNIESEIEFDSFNKIIRFYDDIEKIIYISTNANGKFELLRYKI